MYFYLQLANTLTLVDIKIKKLLNLLLSFHISDALRQRFSSIFFFFFYLSFPLSLSFTLFESLPSNQREQLHLVCNQSTLFLKFPLQSVKKLSYDFSSILFERVSKCSWIARLNKSTRVYRICGKCLGFSFGESFHFSAKTNYIMEITSLHIAVFYCIE